MNTNDMDDMNYERTENQLRPLQFMSFMFIHVIRVISRRRHRQNPTPTLIPIVRGRPGSARNPEGVKPGNAKASGT